jgi:hypothetical protein
MMRTSASVASDAIMRALLKRTVSSSARRRGARRAADVDCILRVRQCDGDLRRRQTRTGRRKTSRRADHRMPDALRAFRASTSVRVLDWTVEAMKSSFSSSSATRLAGTRRPQAPPQRRRERRKTLAPLPHDALAFQTPILVTCWRRLASDASKHATHVRQLGSVRPAFPGGGSRRRSQYCRPVPRNRHSFRHRPMAAPCPATVRGSLVGPAIVLQRPERQGGRARSRSFVQ